MADEQAKHIFAAKLFQVAEVHTETFEIEAANEKEAKNRAEEILQTKDLEGVEHRLEFEDLTVKAENEQKAMEAESAERLANAPDAPQPADPATAGDVPTADEEPAADDPEPVTQPIGEGVAPEPEER